QLARLEAERDAAREVVTRLERDIQRWVEDKARETVQRDDARVRADRAEAQLDDLPPEDASAQAQREVELTDAVEPAMASLQAVEAEADARRTALAQAEAQAAAADAAMKREHERLLRFESELARAPSDLSSLGQPAMLDAARNNARAPHAEAEGKAQAAQSVIAAVNKTLEDARAAEARLTPPLLAAERRMVELEAELKGLDRLLRETTGSAHPPVLEGIRAPGLERALAAALGDDLDAPADQEAPVHWSGRSGSAETALPDGAEALSGLVQAPGELLARLSQCGLVDRSQGFDLLPRLTPGQRLVSREGDLWRWDGFVRRAEAPLPAAEKLEQRARRKASESELV